MELISLIDIVVSVYLCMIIVLTQIKGIRWLLKWASSPFFSARYQDENVFNFFYHAGHFFHDMQGRSRVLICHCQVVAFGTTVLCDLLWQSSEQVVWTSTRNKHYRQIMESIINRNNQVYKYCKKCERYFEPLKFMKNVLFYWLLICTGKMNHLYPRLVPLSARAGHILFTQFPCRINLSTKHCFSKQGPGIVINGNVSMFTRDVFSES